jgi:hypothetical protein
MDAALATLDDCHHPALRAMWDVLLADAKRYARVFVTSSDFTSFIEAKRFSLSRGYTNPTTWSPLEAMKSYLSGDIGARIFLLKHVITRAYGTVWQPTESQLKDILAQYQVWSRTAIWDTPCPCRNKRMKQFVRDCAWMFAPPTVAPVAPAPSAPTIEESIAACRAELASIVIDESASIPAVEEHLASIEQRIAGYRSNLTHILAVSAPPVTPSTEPDGHIEPIDDPIDGPIEPMADPIVAIQTPWFHIPRDCDEYETAE